jgi:hypothetical protein
MIVFNAFVGFCLANIIWKTFICVPDEDLDF